MSRPLHGRLRPVEDAPDEGELSEEIIRIGEVIVEQILSGSVSTPVEFNQDHDEWVVLLSGSATLEVGTERLTLQSGGWVFLPAHVPHRLVETAQGTNWLALHRQP